MAFQFVPTLYPVKVLGIESDAEIMGWNRGHPNVPEIDPNHFHDIELVRLLTSVLSNPKKGVMAIGHTGTGKSSGFAQFAAQLGIPVFAPTIDDDTEFRELIMSFEHTTNGWVTHQEDLLEAVQMPSWYILEEFNQRSPRLLMQFVNVLDKRELRVPGMDKVVKVHPDFRLMLSGNAGVGGDLTRMYAGSRVGNLAFADRFYAYRSKYMTQEQELSILEKTHSDLPLDYRKMVVKLADDVRQMFVKGEFPATISRRGVEGICDLLLDFETEEVTPDLKKFRYFNVKAAIKANVIDKIDDQEAVKTIENLCQTIFTKTVWDGLDVKKAA